MEEAANLSGEVGRRGGAARWGGEDGEANLGGKVRQGSCKDWWQSHCCRQNQYMVSCVRLCARQKLVCVCARAPEDAGADGIDNNLSIPLWKLVDALVEISNIGNN